MLKGCFYFITILGFFYVGAGTSLEYKVIRIDFVSFWMSEKERKKHQPQLCWDLCFIYIFPRSEVKSYMSGTYLNQNWVQNGCTRVLCVYARVRAYVHVCDPHTITWLRLYFFMLFFSHFQQLILFYFGDFYFDFVCPGGTKSSGADLGNYVTVCYERSHLIYGILCVCTNDMVHGVGKLLGK